MESMGVFVVKCFFNLDIWKGNLLIKGNREKKLVIDVCVFLVASDLYEFL